MFNLKFTHVYMLVLSGISRLANIAQQAQMGRHILIKQSVSYLRKRKDAVMQVTDAQTPVHAG